MKIALVIIDMQVGFINDNNKHLVEQICKYIEANKFDDIVATRYINNESTACYRFEGWKDCMKGTPEAELNPSISKYVTKVFDKDKYSCWNEEFKTWVKENKIDTLYFVGVNTGCCVLHSAFDAYNDLQEIRVVEDLCGSSNGQNSHNAGIQVLRECITKQRVISSSDSIN